MLPDKQSDIIVSSHGQAWIPGDGVDVPALEAATTLKGLRIDTAWLRSIAGVHAAGLADRQIALDDLFPRNIVHRLVAASWLTGSTVGLPNCSGQKQQRTTA